MNRFKRKSKFLSLILRHKPDLAGLTLGKGGWVEIDALIDGCKKAGTDITRQEIEIIVADDDKGRYSIKDNLVRANQGHSVEVEMDFPSVKPPDVLYHGTWEGCIDAILESGIKRMARHHVHLSADVQTATKVGQRRGTVVIITIDSKRMHEDGIKFWVSDNGVWLTDFVDPKYFVKDTNNDKEDS